MARLFVSAAHKSSGKTMLAVGLCAAFARRGLTVQAFKKGPDYIDPLWLGRAAGRPCHNLDPHTQSSEEIGDLVADQSADADVAVIEGTKGLFDGLDPDGADCNASVARQLGAPVVLVIDTRGMTRGIAPLLLGYRQFDPDLPVAGVVLNQVGGARHEAKLRRAVETYTDVRVLGAVAHDPALAVEERHLGLIPSNEQADSEAAIGRLAEAVAGQVDLDGILAAAGHGVRRPTRSPARPIPDLRIAIARDAAFGFYYASDLAAFTAAGAELVPFDSLHDTALPPCDGLFLGGGFPETHMDALAANRALRADIARAVAGGLPTYGECGGLMYLSRAIVWGDRRAEMVGAVAAEAVMTPRPVGRGYVVLRETGHAPWGQGAGTIIPAHEFHYSRLDNVESDITYAYEVTRGHGIDGQRDGIVRGRLLAGFAHRRDVARSRWVGAFVDYVRRVRREHRQ